MITRDLAIVRNQKIIQRYTDLYFKQLLREEEIYSILSDEFFLKRRTLYGIILEYKKRN